MCEFLQKSKINANFLFSLKNPGNKNKAKGNGAGLA